MTSATLNRVTLIGFVGEDPELKFVNPSASPVCNFKIATHKNYKTANGEYKEETTWHSLSAWNVLAEYIAENIKKGSKVYVDGEITMSSAPDKNGGRRDYYSILVNEIKLL